MEQNINNKKRIAKTKSNSGKSGKILYDKPAIAIPAQIAPFTLRLCPDTTDNTPTFIDKSHYRITYIVDNNKTYTLRLGIGISSSGVAAISKDTIIVFRIPIMPDRLQNIISLAYINELYSAKYRDSVWLKARKNQFFRVEYVLGSIAVESNNGLQVFPLDNNSLKTKDNTIIICQMNISRQGIRSGTQFRSTGFSLRTTGSPLGSTNYSVVSEQVCCSGLYSPQSSGQSLPG